MVKFNIDLRDKTILVTGTAGFIGQKITQKLRHIKHREYDLSKYDWNKVADTMSGIFHEVAGC